ncbi:hypothetical protein CWB89_06320 [Pseudoalteromonas piscicida]|uniref:Uncharacterized protein n=1 Tax=Pseudoalteromonas piscicida TaxID=43662 RepID=A0AAQ2EUW6_PSEO7|nr:MULTISPECIES: hypothetical protein [Pseudoalteromonas]KJY90368.1 hypothetical protein TW75_06945 [Pseudoalteromonas piscicida]TMN43613.1 hypothetical protein CWB95_05105 [Pseudoalteromonas piscicida]TMN44062.1 hypothetical protein CWB94_01555 [Pseudoalteromonas piscicida]TMN56821.1 hypothetical protein CWB92_01650 [Pseudoalteromonas piscicida]TMN57434.1 hypothetical protein CWB91_03515 [Pseudoalteromonas piscicida]
MKAHFYHPKDDSLEEKAKAYQEAYRAWINIEAGFHFHDQQGWEDRLGSKEDLQKAMEITTSTLEIAISSFSREELIVLSDQKILSCAEFQLLEAEQHTNKNIKDTIVKNRKNEISKSRSNHSPSTERYIGRDK